MKFAIVGCAHGELENIYDSIQFLEEQQKFKIDLLICCGDFQATRNANDLSCMAVPLKYSKMCTFYKYYSGEKVAPVLTIFIGGNHEASNYLQELPYGGWVAPNIYYMGYAGVVNIAGIRIAGLSGIYKGRDYMKGRYEKPPYDEHSKRTVYHIRNLEVFRLQQLSGKIDVFLSHDWPAKIAEYGNLVQLLKKKPFFKEDIETNQLGSVPCGELLHKLKPRYWFAAHLHCKFAAIVNHDNGSYTKFLALDKCLPKRKFLQILDIPHDGEAKMELNYDSEWLSILFMTNHLLSVKNGMTFMPGPGATQRYDFTPTEEEKNRTVSLFNDNLIIPKNFTKTVPAYNCNSPKMKLNPLTPMLNPQTVKFCETLHIDDPIVLISDQDGSNLIMSIEEEQSFNDSTFVDTIDDSNSTLDCSQTPRKLLGNLSLPEPKLSQSASDCLENEEDSQSSNAVEENSIPETEQESAVKCESPTPKKLKRRNINLYQTENNE